MAAKPCLIPAPDSTQQWTMCPSRGARSTRPRRKRRAGGAGIGFLCAGSAAGGPGRWGRCWPFLRSSCYLNISINIKRPQTVIFRTCGPILRRRGADRTSGRFLDVPRSCSESRNRIPNRFGSTSFQVNTSFRFQNSTHYRLRPHGSTTTRIREEGCRGDCQVN